MKKSLEFVKWITLNTQSTTCDQVYYKETFYFINGKNHKGRKDLKELYHIFFKETFNK